MKTLPVLFHNYEHECATVINPIVIFKMSDINKACDCSDELNAIDREWIKTKLEVELESLLREPLHDWIELPEEPDAWTWQHVMSDLQKITHRKYINTIRQGNAAIERTAWRINYLMDILNNAELLRDYVDSEMSQGFYSIQLVGFDE